ncbi:MAG TPA: hypothetical protein VHV49_18650 [Pseudonocardiaceae bacterium]|nr:hypothetical protein [Pseudonocardiaceae bacterium]
MASSSPFADVADGPAADAVVVELGRPTRVALGCFGATTVFLALVALAALSYSIFAVPGPATAPPALRPVAAVLGVIFLAMVCGLVAVAVRAVRHRQGLAFDADAVWCRTERATVRLPWTDLAAVRVVAPTVPKGVRTSAPRTPTVELCPAAEATVRRHPELADSVTGGEPVRPGLPSLRFAFHLSSVDDRQAVAAALDRLAPELRVP